MNIELIQKRVENCFSFSHAVSHIEVYEKNSRFYIELDATCLIELKKIAAEFGDDNIVILPGNNIYRFSGETAQIGQEKKEMNCNKKRFTLRLTDEEFRELTRIKGLIGITTTTKAIRYIINHFAELNNRYIEEINKNAALKEKYKKQDRCIESLLKSISSLKELDDLKVVLPEKRPGKK